MDTRGPTQENSPAERPARWDALANWLALLTLLAVGIVWPPG